MGKWIFCLLTLFFSFSSTWGQIVIDNNHPIIDFVNNQHVKAFTAKSDQSFEEILEVNFFEGYTDTNTHQIEDPFLWLKFQIVNQSIDSNFFLFATYEEIDLFKKTKDGNWENVQNGHIRPVKNRALPRSPSFLPIQIRTNDTTDFFLRIHKNEYLISNMKTALYNAISFYEINERLIPKYEKGLMFNVIYIAGLSIVTLFILMFTFYLRRKVYIYYSLYLIFQIIYGLNINARIPIVASNPIQNWLAFSYIANEAIQFTFFGFYALFILNLLKLDKFSKNLAFVTKGMAALCFTYAIASLFLNYYLYDSELIYSLFKSVRYLLLPIYIVLFVWTIIRVKSPLLIYFIIGNIFFATGALLSFYVSINMLHFNSGGIFDFKESLNAIFQMGLLGEVVCFSIAIALDIRLLQLEKDKVTDDFINQLNKTQLLQKEMNRVLDAKIEEKTAEIHKIYAEIERQNEIEIKAAFSHKIKQSKLLALESQMNPHFIFNSLNSIKYLVLKKETNKAINYLNSFAQLLRNVLNNSRKGTITVEDELSVVELYLKIEKERASHSFEYQIEVQESASLSQFTTPALLLQPFLENAIWHGLMPSEKSNKLLKVSYQEENEQLKVIIIDNGVGRIKKSPNINDSYGLDITRERIDLFNQTNDQQIQLEIEDLELNGKSLGTKVVLVYSNLSDD